jgi:HK97 family phage major capsid protein
LYKTKTALTRRSRRSRSAGISGHLRPESSVILSGIHIYSPITGGTIAAPDRSGTITAPSARRMTIRNLLPSVPTSSGSTEFIRELVYTNNAGPQGGTTSPDQATEGETKPASDLSFQLISSPVITIAHTFTTSRQALDDSDALRNHIETRGLYGLALEEEDELLNGNGLQGTLSGLVVNAAVFSGGATNQTIPDTLRKAIMQVAVAEGVATGAVLNPIDAATLDLLKDTTGKYLSVVVYVNGMPSIWRVGIIETNSMPAGSFLVGDFALAATIRDRQQAFMTIGFEHSDYMARNLALVLLEQRIGLEIHRPNALVTGSLNFAG